MNKSKQCVCVCVCERERERERDRERERELLNHNITKCVILVKVHTYMLRINTMSLILGGCEPVWPSGKALGW